MPPAISADRERFLRIATPEGIAVTFSLGGVAERLAAFAFDLAIVFGATLLAWIVAGFLVAGGLSTVGFSFGLLASFLLWNFYFVICEVHWGGVTIGKRRAGLRVISRDGGPLRAEAIFARNLMRNLELFLPLSVLLAPAEVLPDAPAWGRMVSALWVFGFAAVPLLNRDRLRCGDLVAGTIVIRRPSSVLLSDLASSGRSGRAEDRRPQGARGEAAAAPPEASPFSFSRGQLAIYGIKELQVLEDLLRRHDLGTLDERVLAEVSQKIQIGRAHV
jgi:uncharacterized RDD family membrane protein YckC